MSVRSRVLATPPPVRPFSPPASLDLCFHHLTRTGRLLNIVREAKGKVMKSSGSGSTQVGLKCGFSFFPFPM